MAQSWVVLATGVLIAVAAPAAGVVAGSAVDAATHRESSGWRPVSAVVTKEPATRITVDSGTGTGGRVHTTVRWTAPDHTVRTGETTLAAGVHVGDRTTVWLDRDGALVRDPSTPTDSLAESVVAGTVVGSAAGLLFFGAERVTVRLLLGAGVRYGSRVGREEVGGGRGRGRSSPAVAPGSVEPQGSVQAGCPGWLPRTAMTPRRGSRARLGLATLKLAAVPPGAAGRLPSRNRRPPRRRTPGHRPDGGSDAPAEVPCVWRDFTGAAAAHRPSITEVPMASAAGHPTGTPRPGYGGSTTAPRHEDHKGHGLVMFAGVMLALLALFNGLDGIAAIVNSRTVS
ncbi:hypothetical protein [Streptomyces noursei]|uniref:Rv1733c family protein n=1 Tax=Streptomyces noursei TaxID=1971 RepID=UPI0021A5A6AC|nr:hypothetical protein [Streptomyces noursei]UWS77518.1 hypothetical protein N1H47_01645 [Streptomyces noursei]